MTVTIEDVRNLMKKAGIDSGLVDRIDPAVPFLRQGVTSIDVPLLALATEKEWGIAISDDDAPAIRTIDDVVRYVASKGRGA